LSDFDSLSRGDQYLRLLEIEYQDLLKYARLELSMIIETRRKYQYTDEDANRLDAHQQETARSIDYFVRILQGLKGAENGETISTDEKSESLEQFTGVTCTTVL